TSFAFATDHRDCSIRDSPRLDFELNSANPLPRFAWYLLLFLQMVKLRSAEERTGQRTLSETVVIENDCPVVVIRNHRDRTDVRLPFTRERAPAAITIGPHRHTRRKSDMNDPVAVHRGINMPRH